MAPKTPPAIARLARNKLPPGLAAALAKKRSKTLPKHPKKKVKGKK